MKYRDIILKKILSYEWKSTSKIKSETERKVKKVINWYSIQHILLDFLDEGKIEKIKTGNITSWRKK